MMEFRLSGREVLKKSVHVGTLSIVAGVFGYLYQILLGRFLLPGDFSIYISTISLFAIFSAPLSGVSVALTSYIARSRKFYGSAYIHALFPSILKTLLLATLFGYGSITALFYITFQNINIAAIVFLLSALMLSSLMVANNAFLASYHRTVTISVLGCTNAILKNLMLLLFVWVGLNSVGSNYIVFVVSYICTALIGTLAVKDAQTLVSNPIPGIDKPTIKFALPIILSNLAIVAISQSDIVVAGHFLDPIDAGQYSAAAVLGKSMLYFPQAVILPLFPMLLEANSNDLNRVKLLIKSAKYTTAAMIFMAVVMYAINDKLILFLYGNNYEPAGNYAVYYGFSILPLSIALIIEQYLIVSNHRKYCYLTIAVLVVYLILSSKYSHSGYDLMINQFVAGMLLFLLTVFYFNSILKNNK